MDNIFGNVNSTTLMLDHFYMITSNINNQGDIIEFGTCMGRSAVGLAKSNENRHIFTIDHFKGLESTKKNIPENSGWCEGAFAVGDTKNGVASDVNSILDWLKQYKNITQINCDIHKLKEPGEYEIVNNIVACHVDVDIYEPTVSSLNFLEKCKWNEIYIRFDDWHGHESQFDEHERLAFKEWIDKTNYKYSIAFGGDASGIIVNR